MQIASDAPATFRSSADRPGALELLVTAAREVSSRRRLIRYLVRAEIKKKGTDTVLGNVWWVLDPLFSLLVYVFVMSVVFGRGQPEFGVFLLAAMIPFKWFTGTLSDSVTAVVSQGQLIKQIQFPKIVLPIVSNGAGLVNLGVGMLVLFAIVLVVPEYRPHLTIMVLFVPVIAFIQGVLMLALSMFLSAFTVFYRDIGIVMGHLLRLLFYVAPILWSFEAEQGRGKAIHDAVGPVGFSILRENPIAILLESYRKAIYGVPYQQLVPGGDPVAAWRPATLGDMDLVALGLVLVTSVLLLVVGTITFKRLEPAFAKVL
jgi:lipopolysaccharide transport system permease protein/teichoic acid transport system permease protein